MARRATKISRKWIRQNRALFQDFLVRKGPLYGAVLTRASQDRKLQTIFLGGEAMKKIVCTLACLVIVAGGCATVKPMTDSEIFRGYESIGTLDKRLTAAQGSEINVLTPAGFARAKKLFDESLELARKGEKAEAKRAANEGLNVLSNAEKDAEQARDIMWEVLEYRGRAQKAGAPGIFKEDFQNVENRFREANRLVERDEVNQAKDRRPALLKSYSNLEIRTLKEGTMAKAKASFERAKAQNADDHAPKTFSRAEKELNLATSTLEEDPTQVEKANRHAELADKLSQEAEQTTELARIFDRRKYSYEDIVLWHHEQLTEINKPLGVPLNFRQPHRMVVSSIKEKISSLVQSQKDDLEIIEKEQNRIQELHAQLDDMQKQYEGRLSAQAREQAEKEHREKKASQRFEYVQSLFNPEEAEVFRKGNNVLISVAGFFFPVGGTIILPQNFGLLNKIINSIHQFPNSRVEISGHTDSIGSTELNLRLSRERADNVAKFLKEVGNIDPSRISAEGYGESKPVATNETEDGRTRNRRIDVLLINR
jgi:OOP family OmpA-OmpF porin